MIRQSTARLASFVSALVFATIFVGAALPLTPIA